MNILVTGFEAFYTNSENPTQEVIRLLPKRLKGHNIIGVELPVEYDTSFEVVKKILKEKEINVVIHLGLAQGRKFITPERVAINVDDASIPANDGNTRSGSKIIENGENAYFSTLPLDLIVERLNDKNIPVKISNHAGSYVCNHIMYRTLYYIESNKLDIKAGFIHVPLMDEQKESEKHFSLPLATILEAVICSIKACI